jgi:hypothetical protein
MPSFEEIVRPFQTPDITPPKQGTDDVPSVVPNVIVIAGGTGSGKVMQGNYQATSTVYVIKRPKEKTS